MKNFLTLLGLIIISILYLFEVDYSQVSTMNWIAFAIIFITILYVSVSIAVSHTKRQSKKAQKEAFIEPQTESTTEENDAQA